MESSSAAIVIEDKKYRFDDLSDKAKSISKELAELQRIMAMKQAEIKHLRLASVVLTNTLKTECRETPSETIQQNSQSDSLTGN